jgi:hypothetical protein
MLWSSGHLCLTMSIRELKHLLDSLPDTCEVVLQGSTSEDPHMIVWRDAAEAAGRAWRTWRARGGAEAYAAYRAAQDREDAAQDALAFAVA